MPANKLPSVRADETYLHIYNKGALGRVIFRDSEDYDVFLSFLKEYLLKAGDLESKKKAFTVNGKVFKGTPHQPKNYFGQVELVCYILASTHFHLVLHQHKAGSVARFMRSLATRYSMYFNKKYKQAGALFDRSYKAAEVTDTTSLLHLTAHLHTTHPESTHTSYTDFIGKTRTPWLSHKDIMVITNATPHYHHFVEKYNSTDENTRFLEGITLEIPASKKLERITEVKNLSSKASQPSNIDAQSPHISRLPEYVVTTAVFLILFSISVFKVHQTEASNQILQVLSAHTEKTSSPETKQVETASKSAALVLENLSPKPEVPENASESAVVHTTVVIQTVGGGIVNIRDYPSLDSGKIGETKNNDSFVFVSEIGDWYEIKLSDGSIGYVSNKLSYLQ